ncbi:response regulator [Planococcus halotolerans]|uniref:Response regulator n=1 Tax=Planococcus halotolerans TaxID=2233542 RepID=A0A365L6A6_9BACL|nr:response regulator [Planococcus halotolerans]QHJ70477.1 response regulator [Planococcus halotolerans]RAZ80797.1 response regulator [Planococcus halotolerans]
MRGEELGGNYLKTILIVDDQPGIRMLLEEVFSKEGFETLSASNGREALDIFEQLRPELVLLDMKIPGMDGIEILKRMKQECEGVQVVMMTAYGELNLIEEAKTWGAVRHFTKPFDVFELRETVKKLLED